MRRVAGAEAHDLQRRFAVQVLLPGGDADVEVLRRVVIVHVDGDVVVHAADGVHQLDEGVEVHDGVAVYLEAQDVLETVHQPVNTVAAAVDVRCVERVDLLDRPGDVHHRVARDADDLYLVVLRVDAAAHHGVGVVADLVQADDEEGVHILVERGGRAGVGVLRGLRRFRGRERLRRGGHALGRRVHKAAARTRGRLLPDHIASHGAEDQYEYNADDNGRLGAALRRAARALAASCRLVPVHILLFHYINNPFCVLRRI